MNELTATIYTVLFVLTGLYLCAITYLMVKTGRQLKEITKGVSKKDLKTILTEMNSSIKTGDQERAKLENQIKTLQEKVKSDFQKIGVTRFNPFLDTGGNQSFSLCLLDDYNNGIVITSLHSRDSTRIYIKDIKNGASDGRELSKEEQQALKEALKKK